MEHGIGNIVIIKLTGEYGMIIEEYGESKQTREGDNINPGFKTGYLVRLPDYSTVKFFDFEVTKRDQ